MNLSALHQEIAAIAPIEGVSTDGRIDFLPEATEQQRADAQTIFDNWIDPEPPNWDGFAQWAMTDPALNTVFATAQASAPLVAAGLTTTLLQVQDGNLANFAAAFNGVATVGGATPTQRETWADLARDTYFLPADFVAVVRGQ